MSDTKVINNIDKASRIINLSFSTQQPKEYVNCGRSVRKYTYGGKSELFEYEVAGSSEYKEAGSWGDNFPATFYASRRASLEGRANIYVAPKGETETVIIANVRYIWALHLQGTIEYRDGTDTVVRREPMPDKQSQPISFNTNQVGTDDRGSGIKCQSTGLLESQMLELSTR